MSADDPVVIIGAGLSGAAAAWALSGRNVPVVVLEQFAPGHRYGSSHGSARIVRRAYGDALYVSLTGKAFELWRELELASGSPLLRMLGGIDFGSHREVAEIAGYLAEHGVSYEVLPATEAAARWHGMRFDGDVLFHSQAGTLDADAAVGALLAEAAKRGAVVRTETAARAIGAEGVTLGDGSTLVARCVVVAAGGWLEPLVAGAAALPPLRVTRQQVFHFPRRDPSAAPWPSVIHEFGGHPVYHLAGGRDGGPDDDRKIGEHFAGSPTRAAGVDATVDPAARARMVEYVGQWLPGLEPTPRAEATCLYTETPSQDFVIDRIGDLVVCSPCSGHGAKFAPLVGELVADLVLGVGGSLPERFRIATHLAGLPGPVPL